MLKDPHTPGRGWALTQVTRGSGANRFFGYTLRTSRWRYTEWDEGGRGRELYDHDTDPVEITNLAGDPAHAATIQSLAKQLRAAVLATYPPGGETPPIKDGLWAPLLVKP
jgi:iduronate 2-sulfatase